MIDDRSDRIDVLSDDIDVVRGEQNDRRGCINGVGDLIDDERDGMKGSRSRLKLECWLNNE